MALLSIMERSVAVQIGAKRVEIEISWSDTAEDVIRRSGKLASNAPASYM